MDLGWLRLFSYFRPISSLSSILFFLFCCFFLIFVLGGTQFSARGGFLRDGQGDEARSRGTRGPAPRARDVGEDERRSGENPKAAAKWWRLKKFKKLMKLWYLKVMKLWMKYWLTYVVEDLGFRVVKTKLATASALKCMPGRAVHLAFSAFFLPFLCGEECVHVGSKRVGHHWLWQWSKHLLLDTPVIQTHWSPVLRDTKHCEIICSMDLWYGPHGSTLFIENRKRRRIPPM